MSVINTVLQPRGVNPQFAHHLVRSQGFQEEFYRFGSGIVADLWSTRYSTMKTILVPLPPLDEQREIAAYLDQEAAEIDAFITDLGRLRGLVEERQVSLAYDLVHARAGERQQKLSWHYRVRNGLTPKSDEPRYWEGGSIPWMNSSVVNREVADEPSRLVTPAALKELGLSVIPRGSLLVGLTGEGRTRGMVTRLGIDSTINQHVAALTKHSWSDLSEDYVRLYLIASYEELRNRSSGNGGTKGAITCELLQQYKVPLPSASKQQQLVSRWARSQADAVSEIDEVDAAVALAKERRVALITAAVTGQIDVTTKHRSAVAGIQSAIEEAR